MTDIVRDAIAASIATITRQASTPVGNLGYGTDLVCIDELDPHLAETDPNSLQTLAQDSYHRITTKRGAVPDAPNDGIDIRAMLSAGATQVQIQSYAGQIANELKKDDRIVDVTVSIALTLPATYAVNILITPRDPNLGPFTLIVAVTDGEALLDAINSAPS